MLIDPVTDPRWPRLVQRSPEASVFHHPLWLALLRDLYGWELRAPVLASDDGELTAGLPLARVESRLTGKRLVALPFSDLCPPLGDPAALAPLVEAHRAASGLPMEVREGYTALPGGRAVPLFHLHEIALDEQAERRQASVFKRNVRKGRRSGVTIERRTDRDALDTFFRLHVRTRRHQGVPTQPLRFIRAFESLFDAGLGHVALAMHAGRPIAAAVFLGTGRTLTYKYGASDRAALSLRPNNVLFAEQIAWGRAQGYEVLDLGRTDLDGQGLRSFKRSLGADERTLSYTFVGMEPPAHDSSRDRVLAAIIRHSHPVVGQAIGAALYRHAA
ncbi:MAG: family N-acetyltransferase [Conexibacter sp.]|nr:family N-acetyltransferase [Conexibacter sp.]